MGGLTLSDTRMGGVTVTSVEFVMLTDVAVIVVAPSPIPFARPLAVIVATNGVFDDHNTVEVKFCVLPSLKLPVAWNCCVVPNAIETFVGAMVIETRLG